MCRWELRWKVLLCGLYLRYQVWIAGCSLWACCCFDVWPSVIWEHFPAFSHWEITILSASLGTVMSCLKKCFGTLGSKISHLIGGSIHISCKGNTWYSGKLVNCFSLSSLRWMNVMFLSFCSRAQAPQCTQPCYVTLSSSVQIFRILCWIWLKLTRSTALAFKEWFFRAGWAVGMLWGGQSAHTPPHSCMLGKGGIHEAVRDKWPVWWSLLSVRCRWSCWRDCRCTVLSWLSSWTCWLSPSPPQPCWAATGAPGPRKYPSLCVGRAKPPSAWVSPCHLMQTPAMFPLRTQCTTAGRPGMTALPSDTSTQGCGFPVKRAWKGQVVFCSGSRTLLPCIYSTQVWNWKVEGWGDVGEKYSSFS